MRVCAEVLPRNLSRAMHRINHHLRETAPSGVTFVDDPGRADLQILDVVGQGSLRYLGCRDYVLIQHGYRTTETPDAAHWLPLFHGARLVVSFYDLPTLTGSDSFPFLRSPWGVDANVFRLPPPGTDRDLGVLTTGYSTAGEAILESHQSVVATGGYGAHLGRVDGLPAETLQFSDLGDSEVVALYQRARYVSGLRRHEGFELPVIEGLACGARPICFDTANYRYWFGDHAVYVPERFGADLVEALTDAVRRPPVPVTDAERDQVTRQFAWATIGADIWSAIMTSQIS